MFALRRTKKPLSGIGQRIAAGALLALALIAVVALLTRGSGSASPDAGSSPFTPQSYSSAASDSSSASSTDASSGRSGTANDALGTVDLADLPPQARQTVELIDAGGPFPYSRDGVVFANRERLLPRQAKGWYHEYTVKTPGSSDRGARRIITGKDGAMYYTDDHYDSFRRIVR